MGLLWKNHIAINIVVSNQNMISALVTLNPSDSPWLLTGVYSPPSPSLRECFWDTLKVVGSSLNGVWLIMGDFNTVLSQEDKLSGRPVASSSSGGLSGLILEFGLIDLGFNGYPFT